MNAAVLDLISRELLVPREALTEQTRIDAIATDSIDVVSLISALDTEFQLAIGPGDLERLVTVKDVSDFVEAHAGSNPSGTPDSF